jgi:hypothetical protein
MLSISALIYSLLVEETIHFPKDSSLLGLNTAGLYLKTLKQLNQ